MNSQSISLGGFDHCYLSGGDGGSPLFLIHGFTGSKEDFGREIEPLAQLGYHVIVPELLGHGSSHHCEDESEYSLQAYSDRLFEMADKLGFETFDLLGHSMGGMITQQMVINSEQRIDKLILMDTHYGLMDHIDPEIAKLGAEVARDQGLGVVQELLALATDPLDNPAYQRLCAADPEYRIWAESKMLTSSKHMYAAMLLHFTAMEDRLEALARIQTETLVMVGELDKDFVEPSKKLADTIPGASFAVIPEGGHSPQFEATEAWRSVVHSFLGSRVQSQSA